MRRVFDADAIAPCAIVIIGVSGSGKSTLGALLADRLSRPFLEGDDLHAPDSVEKMRSGRPLDDAERGPWLDRIGQALREAVAGDGVAIASCSALKRSYRERLATAIDAPVLFVLPRLDTADLQRRVESRAHAYMPPALLADQIATFEAPGADEDVLIVDGTLDPATLCDQVVGVLARPAAASGHQSLSSL